LKNVTASEFGEAKTMAAILASRYESLRTSRAITDQTIFAFRVVSSYVTLYRNEIKYRVFERGTYYERNLRWSMGNAGLGFADPVERKAILAALVKICQFILQFSFSNTTTASQPRENQMGQRHRVAKEKEIQFLRIILS